MLSRALDEIYCCGFLTTLSFMSWLDDKHDKELAKFAVRCISHATKEIENSPLLSELWYNAKHVIMGEVSRKNIAKLEKRVWKAVSDGCIERNFTLSILLALPCVKVTSRTSISLFSVIYYLLCAGVDQKTLEEEFINLLIAL